MRPRELLSIISRRINSTGTIRISPEPGIPIIELVKANLVSHVYRQHYSIRLIEFLEQVLSELGLCSP